jgi:spermidine/putrescine transport system permease protein
VDHTLVEAAWDLYATRWAILRRIILPLAGPGIMAGCLLVFVPSLGAFLTPDLLGGARSMMIGNLIQHEFLVARDWPLGAAISCLLMLFVLGMMGWSLRTEKPLSRREQGS